MITGRIQPSVQSHIQVDTLSTHEWRVSDRRVSPDDASSLIGFIEENDGVYEVMRFADPIEFWFATSLEAAVAHVTDAVGPVTTPRPVVQIGELAGRARRNAAS